MATGRLHSLDAFRGATIASMILVNNPGSNAIYPELEHASWHGWTLTDMVFPFFLWIAGISMTLSFAKRVEAGADRGRLLLHTLRRAALIFLLGLFLNGFPAYNLATLRIPGVLQRIAVCYLIAAVIYLYTSLRVQIGITLGLLALYWMLMTLVPVPGFGPGVLEKQGNLEQYIDSLFLTGHMYRLTKIYDPEGILSTIPAIGTALLGILTGYLLRSALTVAEKAAWMLSSGAVLLFAGKVMNLWFPINKNLWTSSFVVFMAGMALVIYGIFYWLIDGQGWRKGIQPLVIYGSNAIAAYVLSGLLARMLRIIAFPQPDGSRLTLGAWFFQNVCAPLASPRNASLLYAIANVLFCYAVVWYMYRRQWFVKL